MTEQNALVLDRIERTYDGASPVLALRSTSLRIQSGELVGLVGRSGSGKSTLLNILGLLDRPTSGNYFVSGVDTTTMGERDLTALRASFFGFVFQSYHLLPSRTSLENVELSLLYRRCSNTDRRRIAGEALDRVEMSHRRHALPGTLSGGECQRVAIARAFAQSPTVMLCDEPTGNLDRARSDLTIDLLRGLSNEGIAVVIATHDESIAAELPRCLVVDDGIVSDRSEAKP